MKTLRLALLSSLLLALGGAKASAAGPTSTLYIMNYGEFGSSVGLDLVQGVNESSFSTGNSVDICIGTYGDVRTMGYGFGDSGSRFDLAGSPLSGGPYTNTISNSQLHDGTSDGSFNYSVNFTTGDILQFDRSWASPVVLFNDRSLNGVGWITMNAQDGSFWLSQWGGLGDIVEHRTHGGALLGSFNTGLSANAGLALDPADGTLWMTDWGTATPTLFQFSQAGSLLQSVAYGSVQAQWYGMEFDTRPVPEPASLAVLGMGALAIIRRRSRLRSGI